MKYLENFVVLDKYHSSTPYDPGGCMCLPTCIHCIEINLDLKVALQYVIDIVQAIFVHLYIIFWQRLMVYVAKVEFRAKALCRELVTHYYVDFSFIVSGSERTFTFRVSLNTLPTLATLVRVLSYRPFRQLRHD